MFLRLDPSLLLDVSQRGFENKRMNGFVVNVSPLKLFIETVVGATPTKPLAYSDTYT